MSRQRANGMGTVFRRGKTWTAEVTAGWRTTQDGQKRRVTRSRCGFATRKAALAALGELLTAPRVEIAPAFKTLYGAWNGSHGDRITKSTAAGYKKSMEYATKLL